MRHLTSHPEEGSHGPWCTQSLWLYATAVARADSFIPVSQLSPQNHTFQRPKESPIPCLFQFRGFPASTTPGSSSSRFQSQRQSGSPKRAAEGVQPGTVSGPTTCFPAKTPPSREVSSPGARTAWWFPVLEGLSQARRDTLIQLLHKQVTGVLSSAWTHHTLLPFFNRQHSGCGFGLRPLGPSALEAMDNHEYWWKQLAFTVSFSLCGTHAASPWKRCSSPIKP